MAYEDIRDLARDVLRHRLVLSYDALADRVDVEDLMDRVLEEVRPQARQPLVAAS